VRYGQPQHLRLEVQYLASAVKVRIEDDGKGFEPNLMDGLSSGHFGLTVMQERAERLGGSFVLHSHSGQGTVIEAEVPLGTVARS
jgi:signal transduction histidine kinase